MKTSRFTVSQILSILYQARILILRPLLILFSNLSLVHADGLDSPGGHNDRNESAYNGDKGLQLAKDR
jgi:hypothetical protein